MFFDLCPTKNIIGITGTKGKGTTASLIYEILKIDKRDVFLGGNIGVAPFDFFEDLKKWDVLSMAKNISPIPLLIIQGDRDEVVDPNEAHMLYKSAKDPKEIKIIKGGDHTLTDNYRPMWEATLKFILNVT